MIVFMLKAGVDYMVLKHNRIIAKILFFFVQAVLFFPLVIYPVESNLDPSWRYGLHLFHLNDFVFGRDLIFTYGPLGYLMYPLPIGNDMRVAVVLLGIIYLFMLLGTGYVLFSKRFASLGNRVYNVTVSAFLLYAAFWVGYFNPDYWFTYLVLFILSAAFWQKRGMALFLSACVIVVLSLFIKFNTGLMNLSCIILFLLCSFWWKRPGRFQMLLIAVVGIPFAFCAAYLCYDFSLQDLFTYVYGSLNLSSAYAYNMSAPMEAASYGIYLLVLFCAVFAGLYRLTRRDAANGVYALLFLGAVFVSIRHGIIRGDHIFILGTAMFFYASIYVFFMKTDLSELFSFRWQTAGVSLLLAAVFVIWPQVCVHKATGQFSSPLRNSIQHMQGALNVPADLSGMDHRNIFLSERFKAEMGSATMTVYPWDISQVHLEDSYHYIPIPVFPINSGTPYLDQYNADFFASDKAPSYIVLNLDVVDGQYPLLNCPALWESLLEHYVIQDFDGHSFLLKRAEAICFQEMNQDRFVADRDGSITLPADLSAGEHVEMRLDAELNVLGKLAKLFYKIPAVYMEAELDNGDHIRKRVFLDVWKNRVLIDTIPNDHAVFMQIFQGESAVRVKAIRFSGPGLKYYKKNIEVELSRGQFTLRSDEQAALQVIPYADSVTLQDPVENNEMIKGNLESLNGNPFVDGVKLGKGNYLELSGWAFDGERGEPFQQMFIQFGQKAYPVQLLSRPDVSAIFHNDSIANSGYDVLINRSAFVQSGEVVLVGQRSDGSYISKKIGNVLFE